MKRPELRRIDWVDEEGALVSFLGPEGPHIAVGDRAFGRLAGLELALPRQRYRPLERDISTRSTWYCRGRLRWAYWWALLWLDGRFWHAIDWAYGHRLIHVAVGEGERARGRDVRPGPWYPGMKGEGA